MLQRDITYEDFDGKQVTETFYFNLSKAELIKMQVGVAGGMQTYLETIIAKDDEGAVIEAFDKILLASVGKKMDGRFIKTQEVIDNFRFSGAYEVLFMQLLTDAKYSAEFVEHVMPKSLVEQVNAQKTTMTVDLPQQAPTALDLSSAAGRMSAVTQAPDFAKMSPSDFADWQRRQSNPLGI